jgi:hypothetical protein
MSCPSGRVATRWIASRTSPVGASIPYYARLPQHVLEGDGRAMLALGVGTDSLPSGRDVFTTDGFGSMCTGLVPPPNAMMGTFPGDEPQRRRGRVHSVEVCEGCQLLFVFDHYDPLTPRAAGHIRWGWRVRHSREVPATTAATRAERVEGGRQPWRVAWTARTADAEG